ncbi:arylsulfatase D isoform X2 [Syngnathoides biaculeatus]|uniref:arylsulfatase D isoform X2 n=1 Tax=Syngnathoides biaculeatus TaxID=300417 RepID=UPI002ADE1593|nr:arylsulfatase D isoform X2 [Syngnathoides biaculeatus]
MVVLYGTVASVTAAELFAAMRSFLLARLLLFPLLANNVAGGDSARKPNVVLVMADDLGIGDLGCYGNNTIRTPNIDRLASEGVKLTQHISAAPVCTPSRAAFVTGRYAIRSGMAGSGAVQVNLFLGGSGGLPPGETTFAKRLQRQGYTTGLVATPSGPQVCCFKSHVSTSSPSVSTANCRVNNTLQTDAGKWHLGVSCERREDHCHHPNRHGFSFFYGLPFTFFNDCVPGMGTSIRAGLQRTLRNLSALLAVGLVTLVCARARGFVDVSPRLLVALLSSSVLAVAVWYVPFGLLPRWNCIVMKDRDVVEQPLTVETLPLRMLTEAQRFIERNADRPFLLFFSLAHVHTPLFHTAAFAGRSRHGHYGDDVEEMDWLVGELTKTVDSLGLANNTLIYFASDHGGHIEDHQKGGWNGIYRGGKAMGGWEGGIRVPGIFRWPGRLAAGKVVNEPTSLMDLYPTLKFLAGDTQPDRPSDGHNLMPLLEGKVDRSEHEFMFHYCGSHLHAARWHPADSDSIFKVHFSTPNFSPPGAVGCHDTQICLCHGEHVTHHDPPLLYDLFRDPSESRPLDPGEEPRHAEVLREVAEAADEHRRSLAGKQPEQLTWEKILWRPWLQPCCGTFPFCGCKEETRKSAA